ncbi:adenosylcobinamide-phosphate synthase CbiB [Microaceticoccus formicicus]|uniref:adenosylcobinamide-phosphate synthase CbiB n=1 Tax=Microaceticoccus formicicus TaxID=3118105 RepID=UPI003CD04961|nr:adenosylcobinamide-phosphate synthase CbiB [Peptoniphilaceae bacterium AMB_02]
MIVYTAIIADWLFGDPVNFPHPVRLMGAIISLEEKIIRRFCKTATALKLGGLFIVALNIAISFFGIHYLIQLFDFNKYLQLVIKIHLAYTTIAAKSLGKEASEVKKEMKISLERGRSRLRYIVGRNTDKLSQAGIIRACVETIAENTSDGVIAPIFYLIFGVPFAFAYKMINTMDSMLGYKNSKYQDLGYFPAKIDDLVNIIPARLTSLLMILSSVFSFDMKTGFKTTMRDHKKHTSPNAGYPESTVAGLLNIQLGGGSFYENIYIEKPYIGDAIRPVRAKDIDDTIRIMYRSEILFMILYAAFLFITKVVIK